MYIYIYIYTYPENEDLCLLQKSIIKPEYLPLISLKAFINLEITEERKRS